MIYGRIVYLVWKFSRRESGAPQGCTSLTREPGARNDAGKPVAQMTSAKDTIDKIFITLRAAAS